MGDSVPTAFNSHLKLIIAAITIITVMYHLKTGVWINTCLWSYIICKVVDDFI